MSGLSETKTQNALVSVDQDSDEQSDQGFDFGSEVDLRKNLGVDTLDVSDSEDYSSSEEEEEDWKAPTIDQLKSSLSIRPYVCGRRLQIPESCTVDAEPMKKLSSGKTASLFAAKKWDDGSIQALRVSTMENETLRKEYNVNAFCQYYLQCACPGLSPFLYSVQTCHMPDLSGAEIGLSLSGLMQGDLRDLAVSKVLNEEEVQHIFRQLDEMTQRLHSCSMIHRDVTIRNILFHYFLNGQIHLMFTDFGTSAVFFNKRNADIQGTTKPLDLLPDNADPRLFNVQDILNAEATGTSQTFDMYVHSDLRAIQTVKEEFTAIQNILKWSHTIEQKESSEGILKAFHKLDESDIPFVFSHLSPDVQSKIPSVVSYKK